MRFVASFARRSCFRLAGSLTIGLAIGSAVSIYHCGQENIELDGNHIGHQPHRSSTIQVINHKS